MAKRHEDRKPGQRFARSGPATKKAGTGKVVTRKVASKKVVASKGPASSRPASKGTASTGAARKGPAKKGPAKKGPSKSPGMTRVSTTSVGKAAGKRPSSTPLRKATAKRAPLRGSKRMAEGLVVKPSTVFADKESVIQDGNVRLNHFLAQAGVCSRRNADDLITGGRVQVNGVVVRELGVRVDPVDDDVQYDGNRLQPERSVYVLVNKPKNVVCTNAADEQKKRVVDLLPTIRGRIFTVGRLDLDSEGLLLVTNDGAFAQEMTHPRYGISKLYSVMVRGRIDEKNMTKARGGVWLAEGPTSGMQIKIDRLGKERTFLKVTLREGKNREIRRVFAKLGYPVISLKRVRIGHLTLHGLKGGAWRFLQPDEVTRLRGLAHEEQAAGGAAAPINAFAETPGAPTRKRVIRKETTGRGATGRGATGGSATGRSATGRSALVRNPTDRKPAVRKPAPRKKVSKAAKR